MRKLIALAVLLPLTTAHAAPGFGPTPKLKCRDAATVEHATVLRERVPARKLGELPPGKLIHTVLREVGGCPELAVVRTNIGAVGVRQSAPARR